MEFSEGTRIRDYTIVRPPWMSSDERFCPVNIGLMADSYMAVDASGNTVLLKFRKCPAPSDPWIDAYVAYQQELRRIVEGNVELQALTCKIVDFFRDNIVVGKICAVKFYFQVFEFIDGEGLAKFLDEDTGYDVDKRTDFALQMMHAMSVFHKAGIVHGDLKPDNLFLVPSDCDMGYTLKVVSLEWSLLDGVEAPFKAELGYPTTPDYSSPEHMRGERPSVASDVFTCGLLLYELLARDGNPYGGLEPEERWGKVVDFAAPEPVLIVSRGADADAKVRSVVHACLNPDPSARPTAEEVECVLAAWQKSN